MPGQIGPDSFALNNSGGVVLQQPATSGAGVETQLRGGPGPTVGPGQASIAVGGEFQSAAAESFKTLDAINKLTQGALKPYIVAQQREMYFDGMSKVIQGQSIQDIQKEQPWYTKIFGPSATVQGAQAMTAMNAVTQSQTEFMNALPQLREQDPDTVRSFLVDQAKRIGNTGDPLVDGLVQSKLAEQWPAMLDTHMKQHFAYQQEKMGNDFVNMQVSNGSLLQSTLNQQDGFASPEQQERERQTFIAGAARPYGMTDEAYGKYMASAARANLSVGNFAAYTTMKNNGDVWNAIPMDARVQLESEEELWTQKALRNSPALTDISTDKMKLAIAAAQGAFPGDEAALNKTIDKMNADWRTRSGASTDIIDNAGRDQIIKAYYTGRQKLANAFGKAQMGLLDDQAQRASAYQAITGGSSALLPPKVTDENAQLTATEYWSNVLKQAQQDPTALDNGISKLAMVSDSPKLRPAMLESQLKQDAESIFVTGGSISPRAQQSLQIMQKMLSVSGGGPGALSNYIGTDNAKRVAAFIASGVDVNDPKALETTRSWLKNGANAVATKQDKDAAQSWIEKQDPGFFRHYLLPVFGGAGALSSYELNDATKAAMAADLAPFIATTQKAFPSMDATQAAQFAYNQVYGNLNNTDFVDGTVVKHNPYIPGAQSLYQGVQAITNHGVNQANDDYQWAVREVARGNLSHAVQAGVDRLNTAHAADPLYKKADFGNFDAGDFQAVGGEQLAGGVVTLYYQNKKSGQLYPVIVRPDQVKAKYEERLASSRGSSMDKALSTQVDDFGRPIGTNQ